MTILNLAQMQVQRALDVADVAEDGTLFQSEYVMPDHAFLREVLPDEPELHRQHVLPGARRAITHRLLEEWQAEGLDELQMAARLNRSFEEATGA